jgi:hypothetical protein
MPGSYEYRHFRAGSGPSVELSNLYFVGVWMTPDKSSQTFMLYDGMTLRDGAASWRGRVSQW